MLGVLMLTGLLILTVGAVCFSCSTDNDMEELGLYLTALGGLAMMLSLIGLLFLELVT